MNYWLLILSIFNILMVSIFLLSWVSRGKNKFDDSRLTKGLQLLQNKISILQDLSDKSDEQLRKWVILLEQKSNEIQNQIARADDNIHKIDQTLKKTLEVSKVFSENIPHSELADRQKTSLYAQAAQLAHQGYSLDQIKEKIDLSPAEIEIVIRLNRQQLQFSEENLPAWINSVPHSDTRSQEISEFGNQLKKMNQIMLESSFDVPKPDLTTMHQIEKEFKDSLTHSMSFIEEVTPTSVNIQSAIAQPLTAHSTVNHSAVTQAVTAQPAALTTKILSSPELNHGEDKKKIRPFEFRKIVSFKN